MNTISSKHRPFSEKTINTLLKGVADDDRFVFLESSKPGKANRHSLLFRKPICHITCAAADQPATFFQQAQGYLDRGFFLAGWFSYEFGYALEPVLRHYLADLPGDHLLAQLDVFPSPTIYHHDQGQISPNAALSNADECRVPQESYQINNLRLSQSQDDYLDSLAKIMAYIEAGDTYQVNYTMKMLFDFTGSPETLYKTLRRNQAVAYSAYLKFGNTRILSLSPELFFRKVGRLCTVRPMKGTIARGRDFEEDRAKADYLVSDSKNQSENVMIVDLLRNDLGRLCVANSVKVTSLFDIETYNSLHQMTSTITGLLQENTGLTELFQAMFPCGSVTGAPKIRTMEIIHDLEQSTRGIYTGAIGYISPNGNAEFNIPIRTLVLKNGQGVMGIGSGIVHDSDPQAEWRECLLKGSFLTTSRPDFQLIETILWQPLFGYRFLDLHLDRLAKSACYFNIPCTPKEIIRQLDSIVTTPTPSAPLRIRVLLFKDGEIQITSAPYTHRATFTLPTEIPTAITSMPSITLSQHHTDSTSPFLFHKTTLRDFYDTERDKALAQGHFEVLFLNEKNEITEGSISNLLLAKDGIFFTPPVTCGLLAGICRQYLLNRYQPKIQQKIIHPADLQKADAIYLMNSVRGLTRVHYKASPL